MPRLSPFNYFNTGSEIIRLAVMLDIRFPLSLRDDKDLLHRRGIEMSRQTVRYRWTRPAVCRRYATSTKRWDLLWLARTLAS